MFGLKKRFILLELQYIKRKKLSGERLLTDLGCNDSRDMSRRMLTVPKLLPGTVTSHLDTQTHTSCFVVCFSP